MIKMKRLRGQAAGGGAGLVAWGAEPASGRTPLANLAKAVRRSQEAPKPHLARTELIDKAVRVRFEEEIDAVLKRKPTSEAKIAGAIRAVAPLSPALRASLGEATAVLIRRGSWKRELCACGLRALSEARDRQSLSLLHQALAGDEAGGPAALSAACFSQDAELSALLAKVAASRQSHLAFGAELARVARGESNGALLAQLAPMIKESHRIAMCVELFVPLARAMPLAPYVGPALAVLRGAERHLGRWLVLAEVAVRAGDLSPLRDARTRAESGPASSRSAWALVAWALSETDALARGSSLPAAPTTRPTLELVARLSDRPSADRDTTFLFRMARAGAASTRPMLEALSRALPLADETSIRAALYLSRDRGRGDLGEALVEAAATCKREDLRGMAAAALWDAGGAGAEASSRMRTRARECAEELVASRTLGNVAWGALIRAATRAGQSTQPLVAESSFRWVQWGALE